MRICVFGAAGHYGYVSEALGMDDSLEVCGIATAGESGIENLRNAFPGAKEYETLEAMLEGEQPDLVAVTPEFHRTAGAVIISLAYGAHVFADKPLALTEEELDDVEAVWHESGKALGAMFGICNSSWYRTMDAAVKEGEIGEVRLIHGQKSYKLGSRPNFYKNRKTFGGLIPWVGIHALDWVMQFGGKPKTVFSGASSQHNRDHGDLEVSASLLLTFENGAVGTVSADYFRPVGSSRHDDDRLRLTGTRGMLEAIHQKVYLENEGARRELELLPPTNCFLDFVTHIEAGTAREDALRAIRVTRTALRARKAADENQAVDCSDIFGE